MKQYEDSLYEEWLESVGAILPILLKKTVLVKPTALSVHSMDSRSGSRMSSRADYSYLLPLGKYLHYCYKIAFIDKSFTCKALVRSYTSEYPFSRVLADLVLNSCAIP